MDSFIGKRYIDDSKPMSYHDTVNMDLSVLKSQCRQHVVVYNEKDAENYQTLVFVLKRNNRISKIIDNRKVQ